MPTPARISVKDKAKGRDLFYFAISFCSSVKDGWHQPALFPSVSTGSWPGELIQIKTNHCNFFPPSGVVLALFSSLLQIPVWLHKKLGRG